jgi:DNA-binding XRE family transcriptional regulator
MSNIQPHQLKALRKACGLTVRKAAVSVHVNERTWRTYETDCSGQLIPDTTLSFSSARAGASPALN